MIDIEQLSASHIRAARAILDLPQRTFAALAGINEETLAKYEDDNWRSRRAQPDPRRSRSLQAIATVIQEAGIEIQEHGIRFENAGIRAPDVPTIIEDQAEAA